MKQLDDRRAVQFNELKGDMTFQEWCKWLNESLDELRVESDTILSEQLLRINQGKRQAIVEIIQTLNDATLQAESLKGNRN